MRKNALIFAVVAMALLPFTGNAEGDSIVQLPLFILRDTKLNQFRGSMFVERIDSFCLQNSGNTLGEVLTKNTSAYVKVMGPGSLSSFSVRGGSVYQTAILWNGMDIRPPGAGMLDLTLIPSGFFETVEVLHGGAGSMCGNGVIGGSLMLTNKADFSPDLSLHAALGLASFSGNDQRISLKWSGNRHSISTMVFRQFSLNNFKYQMGSEWKRNTHARLLQNGLMQHLQARAGKRLIVGYSLWLMESDREIAPSMTTAVVGAERHDYSFRMMPVISMPLSNSLWQFRAGWFADNLRYTEKSGDTLMLLDSRITDHILSTEAEYTHRTEKQLSVHTSLNSQYLVSDIRTNGGKNTQWQSALAIDIKKAWLNGWNLSLGLRHQLAEGYRAVFSPALGAEKHIGNLHFRAGISRNYRLPTLNDRFWKPGSNQDLQPEISHNAETGFDYERKYSDYLGAAWHTSLFVSDVTNWIAWQPGPGYWSVSNIQRVLNRGLENILSISGGHLVRFDLSGNYTFVRSTYEKKQSDQDPAFGKQLMYVPAHRFSGSFGVNWKNIRFIYYHGYTGRTYVSTDNREFLPVYDLAGLLCVMRIIAGRNMNLQLKGEINNVWNKEYQVVAWYPMPGRWFKASLEIQFQPRSRSSEEKYKNNQI